MLAGSGQARVRGVLEQRRPAPLSGRTPPVLHLQPPAANGDLYFDSQRPGGSGGFDLYVGPRINSAANEVESWVAPDGSYLIFSATGRSDSTGRYDLYLSRRAGDSWQPPAPLASVNTRWSEFNQSVSPDGRWLYFSSTRPHEGPIGERFDTSRNEARVAGIGNGKGDIYRIPTRELGVDDR